MRKKREIGGGKEQDHQIAVLCCVETGVKIFSRPSRASDPSISKAAGHAA